MNNKINIPLARLTKNKREKCKLLKSGMKIEILLLTLLNKKDYNRIQWTILCNGKNGQTSRNIQTIKMN